MIPNYSTGAIDPTFQQFMDEVMQGLHVCFVYIDDVLIASSSIEKHKWCQ